MQGAISARRTIRRPATRRRHASGDSGISKPAQRAHGAPQYLAGYFDDSGRPRELISREGAAGTTLVIDRDGVTHGDELLLAHLSADEPVENASVICGHYLRDTRSGGRLCRAVCELDLCASPLAGGEVDLASEPGHDPLQGCIVDPRGGSYALQRVEGRTAIRQLRWCQRSATAGPPVPVSLRDVIAGLESYEPAQTITRRALALHENDPTLSTAALRAELVRVQESPIVLNRKLREVVLATVARETLSMSEIAIRCDRIKRDCKGNESGETSWLARRLGLLPDGGGEVATPWIHSEVLGLIARRGLGLTPREVEA